MSLVGIILALLVVFLVIYIINKFIAMPTATIRNVVNIVLVILGLLWAFGYGGIHINVK